jgi:hypothetical protein
VICLPSIQRESCETGANAMSASLAGSDVALARLRTNASRVGAGCVSMRDGIHTVAGATSGSSATFRGPVRRSRSGARVRCQLEAACSRSEGRIVICTSFSASANVAGDTGGPVIGPVPNVGGAPGVEAGAAGAGACPELDGACALQAAAPASTPSGAVSRNCRRVFMIGALDIPRALTNRRKPYQDQ